MSRRGGDAFFLLTRTAMITGTGRAVHLGETGDGCETMKRNEGSAKVCIAISLSIMALAWCSPGGALASILHRLCRRLSHQVQMNTAFDRRVEAALRSQVFPISRSQGRHGQKWLSNRIMEFSDEGVQDAARRVEADLLEKYPQMDLLNAEVGYVGPWPGFMLKMLF
jgi:hypothetical protein